jgi:hypothetical protein
MANVIASQAAVVVVMEVSKEERVIQSHLQMAPVEETQGSIVLVIHAVLNSE